MPEPFLPLSLSPLDVAALLWFLAAWGGYNLFIDRLRFAGTGLNRQMARIRIVWMRQMQTRDDRVLDAILMGHLIHSVSFFASATMLLLAALIGIVAGLGQAYDSVMSLSFIVPTPKPLFEAKLLVLTAVFVYAFFKFTWALRQHNYCLALIGASPPATADAATREQVARRAADVMSLAVTSFNGGLRAFYFALAVLAWLVHPWLFIVATSWMVAVLILRQFRSRAAKVIHACGDAMDPARPDRAGPDRAGPA